MKWDLLTIEDMAIKEYLRRWPELAQAYVVLAIAKSLSELAEAVCGLREGER